MNSSHIIDILTSFASIARGQHFDATKRAI